MDEKTIWGYEESFWLDGTKFYEARMRADAQMVFPAPVGILKGEQILDGLRSAPRWESVEMTGKTVRQVEETLVLAYHATGRRRGSDPYTAFCSSTYVHGNDGWKLLSHQQTPAG